jgi:hypothetical protein
MCDVSLTRHVPNSALAHCNAHRIAHAVCCEFEEFGPIERIRLVHDRNTGAA